MFTHFKHDSTAYYMTRKKDLLKIIYNVHRLVMMLKTVKCFSEICRNCAVYCETGESQRVRTRGPASVPDTRELDDRMYFRPRK